MCECKLGSFKAESLYQVAPIVGGGKKSFSSHLKKIFTEKITCANANKKQLKGNLSKYTLRSRSLI